MAYNLYELSGINRCHMRRDRDLHVSGTRNTINRKRSSLIRKCIKELYQGTMTGQKASDLIDDFFKDNDDIQAEKTKQLLAAEMKKCLNRYIQSEKRTPIFPPGAEIEIYPNMKVYIEPDAMFTEKDTLEVVMFRYSKPKIKINGKKKDLSVDKSLELFALLQYGRQFVKKGQKAKIKASIYYLRKENDSDKNGVFDTDFFDLTGKNVVTLFNLYTNNGKKDEIDDHYYPQIQEFLKGENITCSEEKCSSCEFYRVCSYKFSPKVIEKEKKIKSIANLNMTKEQEKATDFDKGIARINAGAGAGKTLTVAVRTVKLLNKGVKPEDIVLLTFTTTGAEEMRERIQAYNNEFGTGCDISAMQIKTFNAFQDSLIHKDWEKLFFDKEPRLIDDVERSSIIVDILKHTDISGLDYRNFYMNTKDVRGALTIARKIFHIMKVYQLGDDPEDIPQIVKHMGLDGKFIPISTVEKVALLYDEYCQRLNDESLIEFEDQEILTSQLFYSDPDYFTKMGIKHIIVDEFQDSNEGQMDFIKMLIDTPNFESLMVVGDDSQAIFGFRNTSPKYIIDFYKILKKQGTDFYLVENHRSTPEIIDFANKLNDLNTYKVDKSLIATRPHGQKPIARGFTNTEQEYNYIKETIAEKIKNGTKPEDIAFIAATKNELLKMASILAEANIPSVLLNPEPMMENSKILAALDMIKFINDPMATQSQLNWLNCLMRNKLLNKTDKEIEDIMVKTKNDVEIIRRYPEKVKYETIFAMLKALDDNDEVYQKFIETLQLKPTVSKLIKYCSDFELFGSECAVKREHDYPGVVLTTAHSSKGLEWPIVINSISKYDSPEIRRKNALLEEKRRLLFVSATRARDELYITGQYVAYGSKDDKTYNKFLQEAYEILGQTFAPPITK